jgi:hypothetical protein
VLSQKLREKLAQEFSKTFDLMSNESDRGSAIVGAAILEDALAVALSKYLIPAPTSQDDLLNGPAASFSMKIELAYRVGLIRSSVRKFLQRVRKVRNEFAHSPSEMSFEVQSMSDKVKNLCQLSEDFLDSFIGEVQSHQLHVGEGASGGRLLEIAGPRTAFDTVVSIHRAGLEYLYGEVEPIEPLA